VVTCSAFGTSAAEQSLHAKLRHQNEQQNTSDFANDFTEQQYSRVPLLDSKTTTIRHHKPAIAYTLPTPSDNQKPHTPASETPFELSVENLSSEPRSIRLGGNSPIPPVTLSTTGLALCYGRTRVGGTPWDLVDVDGGLITTHVNIQVIRVGVDTHTSSMPFNFHAQRVYFFMAGM
jgi:hypothetical protein